MTTKLISLQFQPADGAEQTLYIEADARQYEVLRMAQGQADVVVPVHGRLNPRAETVSWVLRGSRIVTLGSWDVDHQPGR